MSLLLNCHRFIVLLSIAMLIASTFLFTMPLLPQQGNTNKITQIEGGRGVSAEDGLPTARPNVSGYWACSKAAETMMSHGVTSHVGRLVKLGSGGELLTLTLRLTIITTSFLILLYPEKSTRTGMSWQQGLYSFNGVRALLTTGLLIIITSFWLFFILSGSPQDAIITTTTASELLNKSKNAGVFNDTITQWASHPTNSSSQMTTTQAPSYSSSFLDVLACYLLLTLLIFVLLIRDNRKEASHPDQYYLNSRRMIIDSSKLKDDKSRLLKFNGYSVSDAYPSIASGNYRFLRVLRSPDGAVRHYNVPLNWKIHSIAEYIVNLYMVDFPVYNPWLLMHAENVSGTFHPKPLPTEGICVKECGDRHTNNASSSCLRFLPQDHTKRRSAGQTCNDDPADLFDCMSAITTTTTTMNRYDVRKHRRLRTTRSYGPSLLKNNCGYDNSDTESLLTDGNGISMAKHHIVQQTDMKTIAAFKLYEMNEAGRTKSGKKTHGDVADLNVSEYPQKLHNLGIGTKNIWNFKQRSNNNRNYQDLVAASTRCFDSVEPNYSLLGQNLKKPGEQAGLLRTAPASLCGDRVREYSVDNDQFNYLRNLNETDVKGAERDNLLKYERRLNRLLQITEDAFKQVKRKSDCNDQGEMVLSVTEAAQAVFVKISRPLQKFLRRCRTQPFFSRQTVIDDLIACLTYDISYRAFLQRYVSLDPPGFVRNSPPEEKGRTAVSNATRAHHKRTRLKSNEFRSTESSASSDSSADSDRHHPSKSRPYRLWSCGSCLSRPPQRCDLQDLRRRKCFQKNSSDCINDDRNRRTSNFDDVGDCPGTYENRNTWTLIYDRGEPKEETVNRVSDSRQVPHVRNDFRNDVFVLKQADVTLMCQTCVAPSLLLVEKFISRDDNQFVFNINSETSV